MGVLTLCFSTFYHCAIKKNTHHSQLNAVSILLFGVEKGQLVSPLTDSSASNYVKGKKPLPANVQNDILKAGIPEIEKRLGMLDFLNVSSIAGALMKLVSSVTNVSGAKKSSLLGLGKVPGKEYEFIAEVFTLSVMCPNPEICKIDTEKLGLIDLLKSPDAHTDDAGTEEIPAHRMEEAGPSVENQELGDILHNDTRVVSIKYTQVYYPNDYDQIVNCFGVFEENVIDYMRIDDDDIRHLFLSKPAAYECILAEIAGSHENVCKAISDIRLLEGAESVIESFWLDSSSELEEVDNFTKALGEKIDPDANFVVGVRFDNKLQERKCIARLLFCRKVPEMSEQYPAGVKNAGMVQHNYEYNISNINCLLQRATKSVYLVSEYNSQFVEQYKNALNKCIDRRIELKFLIPHVDASWRPDSDYGNSFESSYPDMVRTIQELKRVFGISRTDDFIEIREARSALPHSYIAADIDVKTIIEGEFLPSSAILVLPNQRGSKRNSKYMFLSPDTDWEEFNKTALQIQRHWKRGKKS